VLPIVVNFVDSKYKIKNSIRHLLTKRVERLICYYLRLTIEPAGLLLSFSRQKSKL